MRMMTLPSTRSPFESCDRVYSQPRTRCPFLSVCPVCLSVCVCAVSRRSPVLYAAVPIEQTMSGDASNQERDAVFAKLRAHSANKVGFAS
jgi:hypothetical protein